MPVFNAQGIMHQESTEGAPEPSP